jgi:hypothetical protein
VIVHSFMDTLPSPSGGAISYGYFG